MDDVNANTLPPDSPLAALFQQNGQQDPRTALILNAMQHAMQNTQSDNEIVTLRSRFESLNRVAQTLRDRMINVAAALGACPRCMGENSNCRACGGDGIPGAMRPDPDAFNRYVMPAVRRARTQRAAAATKATTLEEHS